MEIHKILSDGWLFYHLFQPSLVGVNLASALVTTRPEDLTSPVSVWICALAWGGVSTNLSATHDRISQLQVHNKDMGPKRDLTVCVRTP